MTFEFLDEDAPEKENEDAAEGEEGGDGEEGEAKAEPPKKKSKKLLLILLPVLLLAIGGGAYFMLAGGKGHDDDKAHQIEAKSAGEYVFYDLPDILVNLHATGRKSNFLKIAIALELENPQHVDLLTKLTPVIVDKFQIYLRGLHIDDLQGSQGLLRLREELLTRVNTVVYPAKVNQVLFKEVLIQ